MTYKAFLNKVEKHTVFPNIAENGIKQLINNDYNLIQAHYA